MSTEQTLDQFLKLVKTIYNKVESIEKKTDQIHNFLSRLQDQKLKQIKKRDQTQEEINNNDQIIEEEEESPTVL